jgi:hypothetical protein
LRSNFNVVDYDEEREKPLMDTSKNKNQIIHKLTSHTASLAMLWEVSHEEGSPVTFDADKAEMMHRAISEMRALLASYASAE